VADDEVELAEGGVDVRDRHRTQLEVVFVQRGRDEIDADECAAGQIGGHRAQVRAVVASELEDAALRRGHGIEAVQVRECGEMLRMGLRLRPAVVRNALVLLADVFTHALSVSSLPCECS
jgi:hypothetical protein